MFTGTWTCFAVCWNTSWSVCLPVIVFFFLPCFVPSHHPSFIIAYCISLSVDAQKGQRGKKEQRTEEYSLSIKTLRLLKVLLPFPPHTHINTALRCTCPCPILSSHIEAIPLLTQLVTHTHTHSSFCGKSTKQVLTWCLSHTRNM